MGNTPAAMPRMQIAPKIDPINCLCKGKYIVEIGALKVNALRRHKPKNEILMKKNERAFEYILDDPFKIDPLTP